MMGSLNSNARHFERKRCCLGSAVFPYHESFVRLMMKWFDDKLVELKMIYRGSDHDFSMQSFDDCCQNKGPMLTII
jgi:hypothetical protein